MYTQDDRLRRALLDRLRRVTPLNVCGMEELPVEAASVVISPNVDVTPIECGELADAGASVIVLAAVMRPDEEARYIANGAASYVAMNVDTHELQDALSRAVEKLTDEPWPSQTVRQPC